VLAGLGIGRLRGGRVANLARLTPRWLPLVVVAAAAVTAARVSLVPVGAARLMVVGGYALALAALVANLRLPWVGLACLGVALNAAVVAANGGRMPVSPAVLRQAAAGVLIAGTTGPFYVVAGPGTPLALLGDTLPVVAGGVGAILSPGDALLALGIAATLQAGMRGGPRRQAPSRPLPAPEGNGDRPAP
jgi:uncharacterized protein DUF5317